MLAGLVVLQAAGCRSDESPPVDPPLPTTNTSVHAEPGSIKHTARALVSRIEALETERDVTCWSSFQQLDNFVATKRLERPAVRAKSDHVKRLARALWQRAAATARAPGSRGNHVFADLLPAMRDYGWSLDVNDYRTTSEHWRTLLAVTFDELAHPTGTLMPLDADGLDAFGQLLPHISVGLLHEATVAAEASRSDSVRPMHIAQAADILAERLGVVAYIDPVTTKRPAIAPDLELVRTLTGALAQSKARALRRYNGGADGLVDALNRTQGPPLSTEAADALIADLTRFVSFVATGRRPGGRAEYLTLAQVDEALDALFPHELEPNGDVRLVFGEAPSQREVLLLDHHMNAIRDTAMHWVIVGSAWTTRPFAMDPFAAEALSEAVSIIGTHLLFEARSQAQEEGSETVEPRHLSSLSQPSNRPVLSDPPPQHSAWDESALASRARVFSTYQRPLFVDATVEAGLPERRSDQVPGLDASFDIQRAMGDGVAVGDVNADGYPDLFFPGAGLGRLMLNRGSDAPGTFIDATTKWAIPRSDSGHHAVFVDIDADDDLDLLVIQSEAPSLLLEHRNSSFVDVARERGFASGRGAHAVSVLDYDGDEDLDLYVTYYGNAACEDECASANLPSLGGRNGHPNELWRNERGVFTEVAAEAGASDEGWTLAASSFDYDRDGWPDLYLANDFGRNVLLRNRGDGTFQDESMGTRSADRGSGMNVSFTDVNADGWWDVYVSNIDMFSKSIKNIFPDDQSLLKLDHRIVRSMRHLSGNRLFVNEGDSRAGGFADQAPAWFEPGDRGWSWGAAFFDYDNDGDDDMYLANGWIPGAPGANQRNQMFIRDQERFFLAPGGSDEAFAGNSRSVVAVDVDRDGDRDLVVTNYRESPRLLLNTTDSDGGHWLRLRLHGPGANRAAVGAEVIVETATRAQRRLVTAGLGYLGQDPQTLEIGTGDAETVDVTVLWPGGTRTQAHGLGTDTTHVLTASARP